MSGWTTLAEALESVGKRFLSAIGKLCIHLTTQTPIFYVEVGDKFYHAGRCLMQIPTLPEILSIEVMILISPDAFYKG